MALLIALAMHLLGTTAITTDVTGAALEHPTILSSTASAWSVELNMSIYTYTNAHLGCDHVNTPPKHPNTHHTNTSTGREALRSA